ncbi:BTAD domain-containing putative transcriptional regulator [Amycolatopsis sp. TNS106]|uniref:AfsR/SARP family transcriptional regulator n=1 Tax=Amycolatopsis sp. TNS106 TaxID=2861750 RepID=UPI001C58A5A2|nr:BTAD domain-containing putative transcriptional regulator [Amycolatopsis sp. TNS106]QXV55833.1 XRE family transcriptional regulator [Amycolatopsis sp. TNS106]
MDFRVLGPVRLHARGQAIAVGEPRRQAVLAVLLLEAGHTVGVDLLIDRVWGESAPTQVRRSLQAHITRIRRALEQADPGGTRVVRDPGGYRLVVRPEQVDVFRFRRALREHPTDATRLNAALELWEGEPLAGLRGEWAERTRRTLHQEHAAAVLAWAEAKIRDGDAASTLTRLTELTDEHPLQETAAAALMRALYAVGRGTDALLHYERVLRALREELGVDPGPELTAVHEAVLRHDLPTAGAASAPVPAQLPADVAAFTGRADVLAELDRLAAGTGEEPLLVCLTGTAGAGKTATAVHWGHRMRDRFPDGQLYLDLCGYAPGEPMRSSDALAALLSALLPEGAGIPLGEAERAARFRTEVAGRRMLVMLDNAATLEQLRPLLPGTNTCVVVVTSRDSLAGLVALHGAHRIAVDRLSAADAVALLRRLIGDRVGAEPETTAELAERCARLPLTLRLAAELAVSRPATPLSRLVCELRAAQQTLELLSSGDDQRAAVRAVFSWSLRQLREGTVDAFALLGRHPAPVFDSYALAALTGCSLDQAQARLDALVRAHLVHPAGADRYGMHDLLKAYAAELESVCDEPAALDRLYGYYLAGVAAAMDRLYPAEAVRRPVVAPSESAIPPLPDADSARDWLDAELPALQALAAHGLPRHTVTLSALLFRYLDGRHETTALAVHGQARKGARAIGDRDAEAAALVALGGLHMQAGRAGPAASDMWAAYALFDAAGNRLGQARALGNIGMIEESAGRYLPAAGYYTRALAMFRRLGDVTGQAHQLTRLGTVEARIDRDEASQEHLRKAMALHREAGHRFGEAWVKIGLGELAANKGEPAASCRLHAEAAALFARLGHRGSEAWALDGLGRAEALDGRPIDAAAHHRQALDLFRRHGGRDGESWALNGLGEACLACGYPDTASANHAEALAVATRYGCHEQVARAHRGLARVASDPETVRAHYERAIALYAELGLPAAEDTEAELAKSSLS